MTFRTAIEFVVYVSKTEYYISYVAWWKKAEIKNAEESIGGGGIRDKLDKDLFWSEVYYLGKKFNQDDKTGDIISYIENTRGLYPRHKLYPSFDLEIGFNVDKYWFITTNYVQL